MADYPVGRVIGVKVYQNDVVVVREEMGLPIGGARRAEVTEFSRASRRRLAFVASNTSVTFRTMLCLTYPRDFPSDGREVKRNLHAFLVWLQRDLGGCWYLWFLEFQKRGAPHVHILVDWPWPSSRTAQRDFRFRVAMQWYRVVGSGDSRHLAAGTSCERIRSKTGTARYAVKYASKMQQKWVPAGYRNVGRFWGCSRAVVPPVPETVQCTEDDIRGLLEGWEYAPDAKRLLYRVLYNQADRLRAWLNGTLDKSG